MTRTWAEKRDRFLEDVLRRPCVMGILNATPDSFSDGGRFDTLETATAEARRMVVGGAAILDVGGESTRPGATPVSAEDEARRVLPVIAALSGTEDVALSVDTYKASVARAAVAAGAIMINDVTGLQRDPDMAGVAADTGALLVLMHHRDSADPDIDILDDMRRYLDRSLTLAEAAGVQRDRIFVDPGIGFGKTPDQSMRCVQHLDALADWYALPLLLGLSRKRFIGHVLEKEVDDRLFGTLAANLIGLERGADILRVHDVAAHVDALKLHSAITRPR